MNEVVGRVLDYFRNRKKAYQLAFTSPAGQEVLIDLARFCRASETCGVPGSDHKTWAALGRHEVWLRIQNHLHLNSEQLAALYSGKPIKVED